MSVDAQPQADEFENAFASFAKGDETPAAAPPASEEPAAAAPAAASDEGGSSNANSGAAAASDADSGSGGAVADSGAGAPAGDAGGDQGTPPPAAETPPAVTPPAPAAPAAEDNEDILRRLAAMIPAKEQEQQHQQPPQQEQPLYTADEQSVLAKYEEDWDVVSKAEELKFKARARDLVSYVFQQVGPELKAVKDLAETLANRAHFADLKDRGIEATDDLRNQVDAWVEKQPGYLQTTYKNVLSSGTVEEVADLVNRFKSETGVAAPAAKPAPKGGSELSEAAKKAAESMAPVSTKRSESVGQEDPTDFEGAWGKFKDMFKS